MGKGRSRGSRAALALVMTVCGTLVYSIPAQDSGADEASTFANIAQPADAEAERADAVVVSAVADTGGYHLVLASAQRSWEWTPLATIPPEIAEPEPWTGYHCVTGDGRWVVAVVAPASWSNSPAARDRGGLVYRVRIADGRVDRVGTRAAVKYYNPGCGVDDDVAVIRHDGRDQERTAVEVIDVAEGRVRGSHVADGQLTSAVPRGDGVVAARDSGIVALRGDQERILHRTEGLPFQLRVNARGIDFMTADGSDRVGLWRVPAGGSLQELGSGRLGVTRLFSSGGDTTVVDPVTVQTAPGLIVAKSGDAGQPVGASTDGSVLVVESAAIERSRALVESSTGEVLSRPFPESRTPDIAR